MITRPVDLVKENRTNNTRYFSWGPVDRTGYESRHSTIVFMRAAGTFPYQTSPTPLREPPFMNHSSLVAECNYFDLIRELQFISCTLQLVRGLG